MKAKLSKSLIENACINKESYPIWDALIPGLYCRVNPSGRKTFYCRFRIKNGSSRNLKIGDFPVFMPDSARDRARELLEMAACGLDPAVEIKRALEDKEYKPERDGTLSELYDKFLNEYAKLEMKKRSLANVESYWKNHIKPLLGDKKVRAISSGDISTLKITIANKKNRKGEPMLITANRVLEVVSSMYNKAIKWEWRDRHTNPVDDIEAFREKKRKRYPTPEEAIRLGAVLEQYIRMGDNGRKYSRKCARLILLLLYTGARRSEIRDAQWKWVSWEKAKIYLPDSKNNEPIEIVVPSMGMAILKEMYAERTDLSHPYIFEGEKYHQHLADEKRIWQEIRAKAKLEDFRLHDLRHAFASYAVVETKSLPMVGGMLHHKDSNTTNRYAHLMDDPLRAAVEDTAVRINAALWGFEFNKNNTPLTAPLQ